MTDVNDDIKLVLITEPIVRASVGTEAAKHGG
jgi:hypothetical protein